VGTYLLGNDGEIAPNPFLYPLTPHADRVVGGGFGRWVADVWGGLVWSDLTNGQGYGMMFSNGGGFNV
jgi:hypothetical protein